MEDNAHDSIKSNPNLSKKAFPFAFQSNVAISSDPTARQSQQGSPSFPLFPAISQRTKHAPKGHLRVQSQDTLQQHPRIFPLASHLATPQRMRPKIEPFSPDCQASSQSHNVLSGCAEETRQRDENAFELQISNSAHEFSPHFRHRSTSYATSQISVSSVHPDVDAEDLDFSEMMNRRMKEAKLVKTQLAEERMTTANLRSQLSASQKLVVELQLRISELEIAAKKSLDCIDNREKDSRIVQGQLEEALRTKESQAVTISEKDEQVLRLTSQLNALETKVEESEQRVNKVKEAARRGIDNMGKNFDSLKTAFDQLKVRYEKSKENVEQVEVELRSLKILALNGVKDIEPFLDSSGRHLLKSNETRELVQELQNERNNAQQVIDLLRDKLHVLSTQLVESHEKVTELEASRKEEGHSLARSVGVWEHTGKQVQDMVTRLVKKEKEDAELLAEGLKLEAQVTDANQRVAHLSEKLEQKERELDVLVQENQTLKSESQVQSYKLEETTARLKEISDDLAASRLDVQTKGNEISMLTERIRAIEDSKDALQLSSRKSAIRISELEDNIRVTKASETVANANAELALERVRSLEAELAKSKQEHDEREEELRQINVRLSVLQERFDSQTMTLKLSKEHSGDLQERLLSSEKSYATNLESMQGKFKSEIAVLQEQKTLLQATSSHLESSIDKLRSENVVLVGREATLQAALTRCREDCSKLEITAKNQSTELVALRERLAILNTDKSTLQDALDLCRRNCSKAETAAEEYRSENAVLHSEKTQIQNHAERNQEELEKIRKIVGKHQAEIVILQEQKNALRQSADQLKEASARASTDFKELFAKQEEVHREEFTRASADFKEKLTKQEEAHRKALSKANADFQKNLTKQEEVHHDALCKVSTELEQRLVQQEETSKKLLQTQTKRAESAERGLESTSELVKELKSRLQFQEARNSGSTDPSVEHAEAKVKALTKKIAELEDAINCMREREASLEQRYKCGNLNQTEKTFVDSLMKMTHDMYEHDMVAKENELRRRDNLIQALQEKVNKLESTLAKCLQVKEEGTGPQSKSMVDLKLWMTSSPLTPVNDTEVKDFTSRSSPPGARISRTPTAVVKTSSPTPTFAKLEEDISDFEDDLPLNLGKRSRHPSPIKPPVRPTRRQKTTTKKSDQISDKKEPVKARPRKRR